MTEKSDFHTILSILGQNLLMLSDSWDFMKDCLDDAWDESALPEDYKTFRLVAVQEEASYLDDGYAEVKVILSYRDELWCVEGTQNREYMFEPSDDDPYRVRETYTIEKTYEKITVASAYKNWTAKKAADKYAGKDPWAVIAALEAKLAE